MLLTYQSWEPDPVCWTASRCAVAIVASNQMYRWPLEYSPRVRLHLNRLSKVYVLSFESYTSSLSCSDLSFLWLFYEVVPLRSHLLPLFVRPEGASSNHSLCSRKQPSRQEEYSHSCSQQARRVKCIHNSHICSIHNRRIDRTHNRHICILCG